MECIGAMSGHGGMMWLMGGFGLLLLALLILGVAALAKYLFFGRDRSGTSQLPPPRTA